VDNTESGTALFREIKSALYGLIFEPNGQEKSCNFLYASLSSGGDLHI
jgi:hypothetical protein